MERCLRCGREGQGEVVMNVVRADGNKVLSIEDASTILANTQQEFERLDAIYREASHARTGALNRLNAAQKAFDAAVCDLRGFAPTGSDWKSS